MSSTSPEERAAPVEPSRTPWTRDLGRALRARRERRDEEARALYEKVREMLEELASADPKDAECRKDLAHTYDALAELAFRRDELDVSASLRGEQLRVARALVALDPEEGHCLTQALDRLGKLARSRGQLAEAEGFFQEELSERIGRAGMDPDAPARYAISITYDSLARTALLAGDPARARRFCEQSLEMRLYLVEEHPSWEREVAISFSTLGEFALAQGHLDEAWALNEHALLVMRVLLETATDYQEPLLDALEESGPDEEEEESLEEAYSTDDFAQAYLIEGSAIVCRFLAQIAEAQGKKDLAQGFLAMRASLEQVQADDKDGKLEKFPSLHAAGAILATAYATGMVAPIAPYRAAADPDPLPPEHRTAFHETCLRLAERTDFLGRPDLARALRERAKGLE